ncbi:unnamed protein product, partial [Pleuronectes platessa]
MFSVSITVEAVSGGAPSARHSQRSGLVSLIWVQWKTLEPEVLLESRWRGSISWTLLRRLKIQ